MIKHFNMLKKLVFTFISALLISPLGFSQTNATDATNEAPEIYYSAPRKYVIGGIKVDGIEHYQEDLLIGLSGLKVGQEITVPGDEIRQSIRKFWRQGLFSDVTIKAEKIEDGKIYLAITLKELPRLSKINYFGLKKNEVSDLEEKIQMMKGAQVTINLLNNAEKVIKAHFIEKGFHNVEVDIYQKDDISNENSVIVDIHVDKKEKVKVANLIIDGNEVMEYSKINKAMKKTNEKGRIVNFFRTKKFIVEEYENDKKTLIDKYNEKGYRDAIIVTDSVFPGEEENTVNVYLKIEEGNKYYFRNINWVGNTQFTSNYLSQKLRIQKGDIYNQKLLTERLQTDDDAVSNLYLDNGYLFFDLTPVEVGATNDSIDLEFRIREGQQATINNIIINGNTKTNEHVVRREIRTKPGELFNKSELIRSVRELAQLGHFNPEKIEPIPQPNPEDGTVDIVFNLEERPNDQVELSGGWGAGMFVGTLGLSFNNFSIRNIFNKQSYSPLPSGDGQSLSLRAQTNGRYYQSYSASFNEPWLGGKRPNSLSVSVYHSIQTAVSNNYGYYNSYNSYYNYGSNSGYNQVSSRDIDLNKSMKVTGLSIGFGKRLSWPDDYFTLYNELSFQRYSLNNWYFIAFDNGQSNNLSLRTTITRNSIDNPIYTRSGSQFSVSLQLTPPYSLLRDDNEAVLSDPELQYQWIEYHKWNIKAATFTPLSRNGNLVLMARAEYGFLGYYDERFLSPFEKFRVGGDGMSGYNLYGSETVGLRGYDNGSLTPYVNGNEQGNMYTRLTMELRYPLMLEASSTIYGLAFLEAGNAWAKFQDFNPFSVKRAAGMGVRIFLPMFGMMGVDWGYGFDPNNTNGNIGGSNFHFVIGQQF